MISVNEINYSSISILGAAESAPNFTLRYKKRSSIINVEILYILIFKYRY